LFTLPESAVSEIHIMKLCVGADCLDDLLRWERERNSDISYIHTKHRPTRWQELVSGGSLYWVIKGVILCRREIVSFEFNDRAGHWIVGLRSKNVLTEAQPRRPFQGWRYLTAADAPRDLMSADVDGLTPDLARQLKEAGVW
jgi:hypothetical protein